MSPSRVRLTILAASLAVAAATAMTATIEHVAQPCRAKNILAVQMVRDRDTGRELLALCNMNEISGMELIFIDFEKDTGRIYRAPAGSGAWALMEVPGGRLVIGTYYDGSLMLFDLKSMSFVHTASVPGETYIWGVARGSDGRVYGGTYPHAKLAAYDLEKLTVEDCGAAGAPNMYLRNIASLPDGRILCSYGMEKPLQKIFDPKTREFAPVPAHMEGVTSGAVWQGHFLADDKVFDGKTLARVPPPFPTPPAEGGAWSTVQALTTTDTLYLRQGLKLYRLGAGDKELKLHVELPSRLGGVRAVAADGRLLGVRGQDYFIIHPGSGKHELRRIPVDSAPRLSHFLRVDEKGRAWGGPTFGQTLFYFDPATSRTVNTGLVTNAGGEVYDVDFIGDSVYAVAYSGGNVLEFRPEEPWDQWNNVNPRTFAWLGAKGYIRPVAGVDAGPDGKLYSGWMASYGKYGGAISISDPATSETKLIENPFGRMGISALACDGRHVYAGTTILGNGMPPQKGVQAVFGMVELPSGKVVHRQEIAGVSSVSSVIHDARTGVVALTTSGGQVRLFDSAQKRMLDDRGTSAPALTKGMLSAPGNGLVCYASGARVILLDMSDGSWSEAASLPAQIEVVAMNRRGDIYAMCGVDLYRVRLTGK